MKFNYTYPLIQCCRSILQYDTIEHSTSHHSTAQHSITQHSTAQHNHPSQHSTAQHNHPSQRSTAQHSTAQHSAIQYNTIFILLAIPRHFECLSNFQSQGNLCIKKSNLEVFFLKLQILGFFHKPGSHVHQKHSALKLENSSTHSWKYQ